MQLIMDTVAENGVLFRVILETAPVDARKPLVTFYDIRVDTAPQKVSDYYYDTLMEHPRGAGLNLHGGVPEWSIDGDTFELIFRWLRSFDIPVD